MLLILHVSIQVKIFFNIQAANRRFANFKMCAEQPVEFEGDEITLGISKHGAQLPGGWTVLPYTHPGVSFTTTCITSYEIINCVIKSSTDPQEQDQHICSWSITALLPFACEVEQ